jgi:hypothetical protein
VQIRALYREQSRRTQPSTAEKGNRRLGRMKMLPDGQLLFGNIGFVREVRFHAFEEAKLPAKMIATG